MTGALAICSFLLIHSSAIAKHGFGPYMKTMWLDMDIPPMIGTGLFSFGGLLGLFIQVLIFFLELFGTVIKCFVLAVRLFANMFAGHMVLALDPVLHLRGRNAEPAAVGPVTIGERARRDRPELAGAVRRLLAGVYLRVPDGAVHGHGGAIQSTDDARWRLITAKTVLLTQE